MYLYVKRSFLPHEIQCIVKNCGFFLNVFKVIIKNCVCGMSTLTINMYAINVYILNIVFYAFDCLI